MVDSFQKVRVSTVQTGLIFMDLDNASTVYGQGSLFKGLDTASTGRVVSQGKDQY